MSHPNSAEYHQNYIDKNPFYGMKIDDSTILDELEGRHPCPKCGKSRKYYCYSCYVPILELQGKLPFVKLPFKIDIIKHKHEIDGKSTAGHAAVLAHEDVTIYTYPDIPDYDKKNVVLIFPSHNAISISQLVNDSNYEKILEYQKLPVDALPKGHNKSTLMNKVPKTRREFVTNISSKNLPFSRVIFIDSTWNQSKGIYKDDRINKIPCVVIQNRISQFWRHQKGSPRWYLATIEAIHQFLVEMHIHYWGLNPCYKGVNNCFAEEWLSQFKLLNNTSQDAYNGYYDNLLYFFHHMYYLIHKYYEHDKLCAYKRTLN